MLSFPCALSFSYLTCSQQTAMALVKKLLIALGVVGLSLALVKLNEAACTSSTLASDLAPCISAMIGLTDNYPSASCCTAMKAADLSCLCDALSIIGTTINIDMNTTLSIPVTCGVGDSSSTKC